MALRLAELMGALSIATDLVMGQPLEFALQACTVAMRLGDRLGFSEAQLRTTYYQALLRYIGCNAEARLIAAVFGDELALRAETAHADTTELRYVGLLARFIQRANPGVAYPLMLQVILNGLAQATRLGPSYFAGHCEVAGRLATRLGFDPETVNALTQVYARWDGKGIPALRGETIAPGMLAVSLAQDMVYVARLEGVEAATTVAKRRAGSMYAPKHVEMFVRHAREILLESTMGWAEVLALEPAPRRWLSDAELDAACTAIADFSDLKSPWFLGHSTSVARLAEAAARVCGLPESDSVIVRRAALVHDVGRVGVLASVWEKPGPLTEQEWEKVRLHPYYTERVFSQAEPLAQIGAVAGLHHERLDGSGYHRGGSASALPPAARILAVADVYTALTAARPHRAAHFPEQAAEVLKWEAHRGRLDSEAVKAVLAAAGHQIPLKRKALVAGLSEREVEVLRLIARGHTIKAIAHQLSLAPKTVDNHVQRLYAKTGVTTRAGATLFAMEQNLL